MPCWHLVLCSDWAGEGTELLWVWGDSEVACLLQPCLYLFMVVSPQPLCSLWWCWCLPSLYEVHRCTAVAHPMLFQER